MPEISNTGVFFDSVENKVVESPPERGVQIVAPGGELTDSAKADIERWRQVESGEAAPVETVTTETMGAKRSSVKKPEGE